MEEIISTQTDRSESDPAHTGTANRTAAGIVNGTGDQTVNATADETVNATADETVNATADETVNGTADETAGNTAGEWTADRKSEHGPGEQAPPATGSTFAGPPPAPATGPQTFRRLYRTNGPISGVAGGLADYFNIDPSLVRVALAAGTLLGGPIVPIGYIAAWLIIPEANPAPVAPITAAPGTPPAAPNPGPVPPAPAPAPFNGPVDGRPVDSPPVDDPAPADLPPTDRQPTDLPPTQK